MGFRLPNVNAPQTFNYPYLRAVHISCNERSPHDSLGDTETYSRGVPWIALFWLMPSGLNRNSLAQQRLEKP